MIEIKNLEKEKAILVGLRTPDISREKIEEYIDELEMLAETAGAETVFRILQDKSRRDSAYYIGKGKAEEIAELADQSEISLIIFDDDLTPSQVRNLEKLINKKIVDRSGLILDIFASHAKTKEAKTQVELAQLQYMMSRLTRAWTHLSKQYGGVGTKGPGETQIETDRRIIRDRISKLKEKLKAIEVVQETQSINRKELLNVSIVGYTNAGKSTLINLLTDANVLAENKLFATLDSITKSYDLSKNQKVLISDTVGFIRKLPHHLIASFKSTLKVVRDADILLHVIDVTNPFYEEHIKVVEDTLEELGCKDKVQVKIFNKIDAIEDKTHLEYLINKHKDSILISAQRGINISRINELLIEHYEKNFYVKVIKIGLQHAKIVSMLHSMTEVLNIKYYDDGVLIHFKTDIKNKERVEKLLQNIELINN